MYSYKIKFIFFSSSTKAFGLVEARQALTVGSEDGTADGDADGDDGDLDENAATSIDDSAPRALIQSMLQYFQSMDTSFMSGIELEAVSIIRDRINNDDDTVERIVPEHLFVSSKKEVRKAITKLLTFRIDEVDRQRSVADAALKKWFKASNAKRAFMYYSKPALIRIAAADFQIVLAQSLSIDKLVSRLADVVTVGSQSSGMSTVNQEGQEEQQMTASRRGGNLSRNELTIIQAVTKAVLQRSFMKPLKGAQREHCKMGHKLELPIGNDFMRDLNTESMLPGFKVLSLHSAGLVGKKRSPWAKDSIDFIAVIRNENSPMLDIELWGIEIKSRQSSTTMNTEYEHLRQLRRSKYLKISSTEAFKHIRVRSERYQLLHHAFVYGFQRVALVVGNRGGKVISGTVIEFEDDLI